MSEEGSDPDGRDRSRVDGEDENDQQSRRGDRGNGGGESREATAEETAEDPEAGASSDGRTEEEPIVGQPVSAGADDADTATTGDTDGTDRGQREGGEDPDETAEESPSDADSAADDPVVGHPPDTDPAGHGDNGGSDASGGEPAMASNGETSETGELEPGEPVSREREGEHETDSRFEALLARLGDRQEPLADALGNAPDPVEKLVDHLAKQAGEVRDLRDRVEQRRERIEELEATLEERETELAELEATLEDREEALEEMTSRVKRVQADFQNYKKRAKRRQEQLEERATEDLVGRIVGVRDNLKRALEEESDDADALLEGVEMTLREFDRILAQENVSEIDPDPGSAVDPQRHEVMVQVDSHRPEGTIDEVYTPGYEMGEKVIQHAQVTVSNGEAPDDAESEAPDEESPGAGGSEDREPPADGDAFPTAVDGSEDGSADDEIDSGSLDEDSERRSPDDEIDSGSLDDDSERRSPDDEIDSGSLDDDSERRSPDEAVDSGSLDARDGGSTSEERDVVTGEDGDADRDHAPPAGATDETSASGGDDETEETEQAEESRSTTDGNED